MVAWPSMAPHQLRVVAVVVLVAWPLAGVHRSCHPQPSCPLPSEPVVYLCSPLSRSKSTDCVIPFIVWDLFVVEFAVYVGIHSAAGIVQMAMSVSDWGVRRDT